MSVELALDHARAMVKKYRTLRAKPLADYPVAEWRDRANEWDSACYDCFAALELLLVELDKPAPAPAALAPTVKRKAKAKHRLTPKQLNMLALFADGKRGGVSRSDRRTADILVKRGLMKWDHECPPGYDYGWSVYYISDAGLKALESRS